MSFNFVMTPCTISGRGRRGAATPSICIPPWAGGTAAIKVGACDPGGRPPGLAPRSPRHEGSNTHLSRNTCVHLGVVVAISQSPQWPHKCCISLLSLSGTPQVRECVAWAAARTACSLEKRLVGSLWENTFSCASEAFLFKSYVLCHAFRASTQIASWVARLLQISLNALLVFAIAAFCVVNNLRIPWKWWSCLRRSNPVRPADDPGPFGPVRARHTSVITAHNTSPSSCSNVTFSWRPRRHCAPPPERLEPVLSSGVHVIRPVVRFCVFMGGAEATFSVIPKTMEFLQPRPSSFFLRSRCRRRIPGRARGRRTGCAVCSGSSMTLVAVLDSLDLCHRHDLGDPLVFCRWSTGLVVLPLTRPIFIIGLVTAAWPAYSSQGGCSSCVASREEPNTCETRRTLGRTLACCATCLNMVRKCVGQANNLSVNRNGLCEYHHMQQRLPRGLHAYRDHSSQLLHTPHGSVVQVQVRRRTRVCKRTSGHSNRRLTLPTISHRGPELLDTHASIDNV